MLEPFINTDFIPVALGGSLSTYTPSKVHLQAESFQLGVTKSSSPTTNGSKSEMEDASTTTNGGTSKQ